MCVEVILLAMFGTYANAANKNCRLESVTCAEIGPGKKGDVLGIMDKLDNLAAIVI